MGLQDAAPAVGDTDAVWSADANAITGLGIMHLANPARGVHKCDLAAKGANSVDDRACTRHRIQE